MYLANFGCLLKELRENKSLTQTELGNMLGITKAVISKYETSMSYPPYDTLIQMSNIFKVTTDYMLGIEKYKTINTDGLTKNQIDSIICIIEEYKKLNKL